VPVIYSLGNAVSNMSKENTRLELAVRARFVSHPDGHKEMLEPELSFLWCCLPGKLRDNYVTIPVAAFTGRRDEWRDPSDYDNMITTYHRVTKETGIYEENHQAGSN
jgi:poly-gamma-glutamate synthesis protein (capsule biosynthesis protein)